MPNIFCTDIVEMHGGSLYVTSQGEGYGCTFTIELPVTIIDTYTAADNAYNHHESNTDPAKIYTDNAYTGLEGLNMQSSSKTMYSMPSPHLSTVTGASGSTSLDSDSIV